ncbi:hypothetical protein, partial [Polymorphobacter multimanifer]|uniref:hypothetical protein n=1 Tax=Polymorphobacter multimanifer TaxID=1070431 RepID=UPI001A9C820E
MAEAGKIEIIAVAAPTFGPQLDGPQHAQLRDALLVIEFEPGKAAGSRAPGSANRVGAIAGAQTANTTGTGDQGADRHDGGGSVRIFAHRHQHRRTWIQAFTGAEHITAASTGAEALARAAGSTLAADAGSAKIDRASLHIAAEHVEKRLPADGIAALPADHGPVDQVFPGRATGTARGCSIKHHIAAGKADIGKSYPRQPAHREAADAAVSRRPAIAEIAKGAEYFHRALAKIDQADAACTTAAAEARTAACSACSRFRARAGEHRIQNHHAGQPIHSGIVPAEQDRAATCLAASATNAAGPASAAIAATAADRAIDVAAPTT